MGVTKIVETLSSDAGRASAATGTMPVRRGAQRRGRDSRAVEARNEDWAVVSLTAGTKEHHDRGDRRQGMDISRCGAGTNRTVADGALGDWVLL